MDTEVDGFVWLEGVFIQAARQIGLTLFEDTQACCFIVLHLREVEVYFRRGCRDDQETLIDQGLVDDLAVFLWSRISTHGSSYLICDS